MCDVRDVQVIVRAPKELHVLDGPEALLLLLGQHRPGRLVRDGAHLPVDDVAPSFFMREVCARYNFLSRRRWNGGF